MRNFLVSLMFSCWLTIYDASAVQHNLFYGNCVYDNNTVPIYKQVVIMENPSAVHVPSKPIRRWYDWFSNIPLRRRAITSAPIVSGKVIDATVVYPPHVSLMHHLILSTHLRQNVRLKHRFAGRLFCFIILQIILNLEIKAIILVID